MDNTKNKIPNRVKTSIGMFFAVAIFLCSAAIFPDSSLFVNSALALAAGSLAIFS